MLYAHGKGKVTLHRLDANKAPVCGVNLVSPCYMNLSPDDTKVHCRLCQNCRTERNVMLLLPTATDRKISKAAEQGATRQEAFVHSLTAGAGQGWRRKRITPYQVGELIRLGCKEPPQLMAGWTQGRAQDMIETILKQKEPTN